MGHVEAIYIICSFLFSFSIIIYLSLQTAYKHCNELNTKPPRVGLLFAVLSQHYAGHILEVQSWIVTAESSIVCLANPKWLHHDSLSSIQTSQKLVQPWMMNHLFQCLHFTHLHNSTLNPSTEITALRTCASMPLHTQLTRCQCFLYL